MSKQINILGVNFESINTALFLANSDWQVHLISDTDTVNAVLKKYQFDRQLSLLWQFYTNDQKIIIKDCIENNEHFWLFFDENSDIDVSAFDLKPNSQVLLSGAKEIGFFDALAQNLQTNWVYYVPFNFLKDGNNFNAFFNIELLMLGEKMANSANRHEILGTLIKNSKNHAINTIKTVEFTRASIIAMLATRLSFINEMARLADSETVNIDEVQGIMGKDSRIGGHYLKAGWGFGGKSLPSELDFLMKKFEQNQVDMHLLQAVKDINDDQKELIFRKFWQHFNGDIENKTVVIWGAGYRTGTSRTTGSAIHSLLKLFWNYGIKTFVYTVHTSYELNEQYGDEPLFELIDNPYEKIALANALFVINWANHEKIEMGRLNEVALPIFDAKNLLGDPEILAYQGFYCGIGKVV